MDPPDFAPIASFFGIWHEHKRAGHHNLHQFYWLDETDSRGSPLTEVMLLNVHEGTNPYDSIPTYRHLKPSDVPILHRNVFDKSLLLDVGRRHKHISGYKASRPGLNCHEVCSSLGLRCNPDHLPYLNTCAALNAAFGTCVKCERSHGNEQPAYVDPTAQAQYFPGYCLVNSIPSMSTCEASHSATYRLCGCSS